MHHTAHRAARTERIAHWDGAEKDGKPERLERGRRVAVDEGAREDDERGLADADSHAANEQAPEAPSRAAQRDGEDPDEEAGPDEAEGVDALGRLGKRRACGHEANHEGGRQAAVAESRQVERALRMRSSEARCATVRIVLNRAPPCGASAASQLDIPRHAAAQAALRISSRACRDEGCYLDQMHQEEEAPPRPCSSTAGSAAGDGWRASRARGCRSRGARASSAGRSRACWRSCLRAAEGP